MSRRRSKSFFVEEGASKSWGLPVKAALIYPNHRYVGLSNLGFQCVYELFNSRTDTVCESFFLPEGKTSNALSRTEKPLRSQESGHLLSEFDLAAFTISFENDLPNVLKILELCRIPLFKEERNEFHPIVLAGGMVPTANPEPLTDFIDLFALGEAENLVDPIADAVYDLKDAGEDRRTLIERLSEIPGIYNPDFFDIQYDVSGKISAIERLTDKNPPGYSFVEEIDRFVPKTVIHDSGTEFSNMRLVEVGRGCPRGCRFCMVSKVYGKARFRSKEVLLNTVKSVYPQNSVIGLVAASLGDYPDLSALCRGLLSSGYFFSLSSLRIDRLTENFVKMILESGQKTVTLAPETGSEKLRYQIGKNLPDEKLMEAVKLFGKYKIPRIKLYFLIGLPDETNEDVKSIILLVKRIIHVLKTESRNQAVPTRLHLSVNSFVPKPWTAFEREPVKEPGELKKKLNYLKREAASIRNVKLTHDLPKWSVIQALLSLGDRRVGRLLYEVHQLKGNWAQCLKQINISLPFYAHRRKDADEILPWNHLRIQDHTIPLSDGISPKL